MVVNVSKSISGSGDDLPTTAIYDESDTRPDDLVHSLTAPSTLPGDIGLGLVYYQAPSEATLDANTLYFVTIISSGKEYHTGLNYTNVVNSGAAAGWSINASLYYEENESLRRGGKALGGARQIAVIGEAK